MTRPAPQHPSFVEGLDGPGGAQSGNGILRVRITNDAGRWTVAVEGEVDLSNAAVLEQAIRQLEPSVAETITVDLSRIDFIDLSGVRVIVSADARLEDRLRLVKGPPAVQSVFHLTGAEAMLPFEHPSSRQGGAV